MKARKIYLTGLSAAIILTVVASGFGTVIMHDFASAMNVAPERFTELYFTDSRSIPAQISVSNPNTLHFTVSNHEGARISYPYIVTISENGFTKSVKKGRVTLISEQKASLPVVVTATKPAATYTITIELPDQNQSIHFRSQS